MTPPENATAYQMHSLLFSRDRELISLVGAVLKTLNINVSRCSAALEAVQNLTHTKFDVIIVDNADAPGAVAVLSAAKSLPSCQQSIGVVLAISPSSIGLAEGSRSHMVVYRPLSADRLSTGIQSALGLRNEREDARESERTSTNIPATLRGAALEGSLAFITNIGAGGASLNVGHSIPSSSIQTIEFSLPGTHENFTTSVELVWRDVQGRVGLRFTNMSAILGEGLQKWLAAHPESQRAF
jgi:PilZ domain